MSFRKGNDINNKPIGIFIIAGLFIAIPLVMMLIIINKYYGVEGSARGITIFALLFLSVFLFLGVVFFVYGIYKTFQIIRIKTILKGSGYEGYATLLDYKKVGYSESNNSFTGEYTYNEFFKIKYEYIDERGTVHRSWSVYTYDFNQKEYLVNKKTFDIKYKGKLSVITETFSDNTTEDNDQKNNYM